MNVRSLRPLLGFIAALFTAAVPAVNSTPPLTWHGATEIASGRGEKGPWRQNESKYDYVDDPAVAIGEQGEIVVAWVEQGRKDVYFQRYAADGTKPPGKAVNVSRTPATFSWLPRIALAPDAPQRVFVLWQEIIFSGGSHGGEILLARSEDGGATFSRAVNLSNSTGGDGKGRINRDIWHNGSLDIAAARAGVLYVAWTEYDGPLWFSRSADNGKSFSRPLQVAGGNAKPARAPTLASRGDRTVYLAWTVGEDDSADIHLAKSTDAGATFGEPKIVARSKGYTDAPKLAVGPQGTLHAVYAESAGGPFDRYQIRYTRSTDAGRTFEPPREISQPAPKGYAAAGFPDLGIDAGGNAYVIWELYQDGQRPRGLGLAVSRDDGRNFTRPVLVPDSVDPAGGANGSHQGLLMKKLAVNDAGAVAIVNSSLKQNERSRVWFMRGALGN